MPRPSLYKTKRHVQIILHDDEKEALEAWCASYRISASDAIRQVLAPLIQEGKQIQNKELNYIDKLHNKD